MGNGDNLGRLGIFGIKTFWIARVCKGETKKRLTRRRRRDTTSVVVVDSNGVAIEKYTIGHQTDIGVAEAVEFLRNPGIRIKKGQ